MTGKKIRVKSKRARRRESCTFVIEILDWDMSYSFSLDPERRITPGPYWEHASLNIQGRFVEPATLLDRTVEMIIIGDRRETFAAEKPEEVKWTPKAIGGLIASKSQAEYLGSVPFDTLQLIVSLLGMGKIKFLILSGEALYRSRTDIKSIHFEKDFISDAWM
jgi:hypothetical protein